MVLTSNSSLILPLNRSEIIFVTGWNEWIMGRFDEWMGIENAFPTSLTMRTQET